MGFETSSNLLFFFSKNKNMLDRDDHDVLKALLIECFVGLAQENGFASAYVCSV